MKKITRSKNIILTAILLISVVLGINCNTEALAIGTNKIITDNKKSVVSEEDYSDEEKIILKNCNFSFLTYYLKSDTMSFVVSESYPSYSYNKKIEECDGYEIRYAKNKLFENSQSKKFIKNKKSDEYKDEYKINGLDIGNTYYFSIRGYKKFDDTMLYGEWSDTKKFKIYKIGQPEIISVSNKGKKVYVKWKKASGTKIKYRVYVDTKDLFWYNTTKKTSSVLDCKGLKKGIKFKVFVQAYVCQKGEYLDTVIYSSKTIALKLK